MAKTEDAELTHSQELGENIAAFRKSMKIQRSDLAQKLNITVAALGQWERGERTPSLDNIFKLAEILKVDVADLLENSVKRRAVIFDYRLERAKEIFSSLFTKDKNLDVELITATFFDDGRVTATLPPNEDDKNSNVVIFESAEAFIKVIENAVIKSATDNITILQALRKFIVLR
jgi:transcriptional regulator with XRE-family HTH domain